MTKRKQPEDWQYPLIHERNFDRKQFRVLPEHSRLSSTQGTVLLRRDGEQVLSRFDSRVPEGYWMPLTIRESVSRSGGGILRPCPYHRVHVGRRPQQLARLMLFAWVGSPPNEKDTFARHNDGNTLNDNLDNLSWASHKTIANGRIQRGTWCHGERMHTSILTEDQVKAIREIVSQNISQYLLSRALRIPQARLSEIVKKKSWNYLYPV